MTFVTCVLLCCTTVTTPTNEWNKNNQNVLEIAQKNCKTYYKESPCLVKLIKKDEQTFNAICGKNNK